VGGFELTMHEMSIAQSVLDIAFGEMRNHASDGITKIKLSIGEFSGVVRESLEFAFLALTPGTPAAGADIEIDVIPINTECRSCGSTTCRLNDLNLLCPRCGEPVRITGGREMKVDYVDLM